MPIHAYMSLKGTNQGFISQGCGAQAGHEDEVLVYQFDHQVMLPTDQDTGQPAGRRQHTPFRIVKKIDGTTPLLYKALTMGEPVDVEFKLFSSSKGAEVHYFTVHLKAAVVVQVRAFMPSTFDPKSNGVEHMEEVAMSYENIVWTHHIKNKEHEDGWKMVGKTEKAA